MKSVILASLMASACAFAPTPVARSSTSLNEFCNGYVGGAGPEPMFIGETGSKNFDPVGFCEVRRPWRDVHVESHKIDGTMLFSNSIA